MDARSEVWFFWLTRVVDAGSLMSLRVMPVFGRTESTSARAQQVMGPSRSIRSRHFTSHFLTSYISYIVVVLTMKTAASIAVLSAIGSVASAFSPSAHSSSLCKNRPTLVTPTLHVPVPLHATASANEDGVIDLGDDEYEEVEPGKMRVSEIKAELKLRNVDFGDCFDKESLAARLAKARMQGKADPSLVDDFKQRIGEKTTIDIDDEVLQSAVGGDGTLPGGMPPDMLKSLMSNPELVELLQSEKMQSVMKLMMTEGQEGMQKAMEEDQEVYELVMKLNKVMAESQ